MKKLSLITCFVFLAAAACFAQQEQDCDCAPPENAPLPNSLIFETDDCDKTNLTIDSPMFYIVDEKDETFMIVIPDDDVLKRLQKEKPGEEFQKIEFDVVVPTLAHINCDDFQIFDNDKQHILQGGPSTQIFIGRTSIKKPAGNTTFPLENGDKVTVIMGIKKKDGVNLGGRGKALEYGFGYTFSNNFSVDLKYHQNMKQVVGAGGHGGRGGFRPVRTQISINIRVTID